MGAAFLAYYERIKKDRKVDYEDSMKGCYLGCSFSNKEITDYLNKINAPFKKFNDEKLFGEVSKFINEGKVIGWFNGAMEFGPRALGARSIIGDPRNEKMQAIMNLKIKYRESFRPFAPSILDEDASSIFDINTKSPYMLLVAKVKKKLRKKVLTKDKNLFGIEKLNIPRSSIPAVTHIDHSARIQTVSKKTNERYYYLIKAFKDLTGCPTLINTSFNVRGEPIVCSPEDAYRCFMRTEMDILVMENIILWKENQPKIEKNQKWKEEFELD